MASRGQVYQRSDRPGFYARFKHQGRFVHRGGFTSAEAAEDWIHGERRRLEREELLGVPTVRTEVTFGRFLPKWKEWAEGRWSPTTFASALTAMESVLVPALRDRPIGGVTVADLGEVLDGLESRRGLSGATRNRYLSLLSSLFRLAVRRGLARENPALKVERGKERLRAMPYLGADEEARLMAALPGWLRVPVLVALDAGLRAGEISALTRRDVDLGRGVVVIPRSKNRRPRQVDGVRWPAPR